MHQQQVDFIKTVKAAFPEMFKNKSVIDVGSQDINGSNLQFFEDCEYLGMDIGEGKNVDVVAYIHEWIEKTEKRFDVVISGEMLEHDEFWEQSIKAMYKACKPGGLIVITCAAPGRPEHGTKKSEGWCSPFTTDYYRNISKEDLEYALEGLPFEKCEASHQGWDLYFWGVKAS